MPADVYVLASPTPILYIYPSQLHPVGPVVDSGFRGNREIGYFNPYPHPLQPRVPKRRRRLEEAVLVLEGGTS